LLAGQFPQWASLPIEPLPPTGTDNAIYRLGEELAVRLPRIHWAAGQVEKEHRWLPKLAPHLPLAIPVPLAMGHPAEGYPWRWGVYPWLPGENATPDRIADLCQAAVDLAAFITALQRIAPAGGPAPGRHNAGRGAPLAMRDAATRAAIASLGSTIDSETATAAWDAALHTPNWEGPPVWLHGDLQSGNLLVDDGRLCAVIDFGCLGTGDPACDVLPAWTLFSGASRERFRAALAVDNATWARGRGWALSFALIALPYYWDTNPVLVRIARHTLTEALAEFRSGT
jgi:aminoglycoside phosphotransferase (APT) family kinase protein